MEREGSEALPEIYFHGEEIVVIRFIGHVDSDSLTVLRSKLADIVANKRLRGAIFDTLAVTSVNPNVTLSGGPFLAVLLKRGCSKGTCAATSPMVRMLGSSIALAAGMRIRFYPTMDDAKREIAEMISRESR